MAIGGISGFKNSSVSFGQKELIDSKNKNISLDKFERRAQREEIVYDRKQTRKAKKSEPVDGAPAAPEAPLETKPVTEDKEAKTYAERYVALYEKNAGRTLTEEQRSAKIKEVAEFYSTASRTGRLENLVNQLS